MSKEITFILDERNIKDNKVVYHGYYNSCYALFCHEEKIFTTQIALLDTKLFNKGYKIFIREYDGSTFEIKLGCNNTRTNKEIKESHNLQKLLLSGIFSK